MPVNIASSYELEPQAEVESSEEERRANHHRQQKMAEEALKGLDEDTK